jgi:hypothetical protein
MAKITAEERFSECRTLKPSAAMGGMYNALAFFINGGPFESLLEIMIAMVILS